MKAVCILGHDCFMSQRHRIQHDVVMLVTSVTIDRERYFDNPAVAREAVETLYRVRERHPFFLYGFVVMPDHVHLLLKVRMDLNNSLSKVMNIYKSGLTFNTGIRQMWQRGFDSRFAKEPLVALEYIHMNPVQAGIVKYPHEYPWSSANERWKVDPLLS